MPWAQIIVPLVMSLASSGRSSEDRSYNAFLSGIANKVLSDSSKDELFKNAQSFING